MKETIATNSGLLWVSWNVSQHSSALILCLLCFLFMYSDILINLIPFIEPKNWSMVVSSTQSFDSPSPDAFQLHPSSFSQGDEVCSSPPIIAFPPSILIMPPPIHPQAQPLKSYASIVNASVNLPKNLWSDKDIGFVASLIDKHIRMDEFTASRQRLDLPVYLSTSRQVNLSLQKSRLTLDALSL